MFYLRGWPILMMITNPNSEAESLATHEIENFEYLVGMIIWQNLLFTVNSVSKTLQK